MLQLGRISKTNLETIDLHTPCLAEFLVGNSWIIVKFPVPLDVCCDSIFLLLLCLYTEIICSVWAWTDLLYWKNRDGRQPTKLSVSVRTRASLRTTVTTTSAFCTFTVRPRHILVLWIISFILVSHSARRPTDPISLFFSSSQRSPNALLIP